MCPASESTADGTDINSASGIDSAGGSAAAVAADGGTDSDGVPSSVPGAELAIGDGFGDAMA